MRGALFLPPVLRDPVTPNHIAEAGTFRLLARFLFLLLSLMAIVGCTSPRRAELVVCVEQEPSTLDPRVGSDLASERVAALLHRGLFRTGQDFAPVGDLVASWEQPTPTLFRFELLAGVRFADGREVTARDAAFTLESVRTGASPSARRADLEAVVSARAVGEYTLEVELSRPCPALPSGLNFGVVPEGTAPGSAPPGCGPYRLERWVRGQSLLFSANPHADPPPRCRTLAFKVVPDAVVRALEMRRGSVDLVVNDLPPDSLAYFGRGGYRVDRYPGANYRYIGIHCARRPLDRPEVRRALAMAVDRDALLRFVQDGFGRPAAGLLCPENWAVAQDIAPPSYDPEGARKLLSFAGYGPGRPLRLTYKTSADKVARRIAVSVQEYLRRVGVEVEIRSMEWAAFYADVQRGDFDLFGLVWVGISDPDALRLRFTSRSFPPDGLNRGRYSNGEVDRLLEAAAAEGDRALRKEMYIRAQRILAQEVPYVPLWHPDNVAVSRAGLEGVVLSPDGSFSFLANVGWTGPGRGASAGASLPGGGPLADNAILGD